MNLLVCELGLTATVILFVVLEKKSGVGMLSDLDWSWEGRLEKKAWGVCVVVGRWGRYLIIGQLELDLIVVSIQNWNEFDYPT